MYIPHPYQTRSINSANSSERPIASPANTPVQAGVANMLLSEQASYTSMFLAGYNKLQKQGFRNIRANQDGMSNKANWPSLRNRAVKLAAEYEKLSVRIGGSGVTRKWTLRERIQIYKGKSLGALGYQGHHGMNVNNHPDFMAETNNIRFLNPKEHLRAHGGNFKNETNTPMIDKDAVLRSQFKDGQIRREFYGLGAAAFIGFISTVSISAIIELSDNGVDIQSLKDDLRPLAAKGTKGAATSAAYYGGFRLGSVAIDEIVKTAGTRISSNATKFLKSNGGKVAIIGGIIIAAESCVDVKSDIDKGESWRYALSNCAQKQAIPIGLLGLSAWQPEVGIPISILYTCWQVYSAIGDKKQFQKAEYHGLYHEHKLLTKRVSELC